MIHQHFRHCDTCWVTALWACRSSFTVHMSNTTSSALSFFIESEDAWVGLYFQSEWKFGLHPFPGISFLAQYLRAMSHNNPNCKEILTEGHEVSAMSAKKLLRQKFFGVACSERYQVEARKMLSRWQSTVKWFRVNQFWSRGLKSWCICDLAGWIKCQQALKVDSRHAKTSQSYLCSTMTLKLFLNDVQEGHDVKRDLHGKGWHVKALERSPSPALTWHSF